LQTAYKFYIFVFFTFIFLINVNFNTSKADGQSLVATLDQERLFRDSLFGKRVLKEVNLERDALLANELTLQSQLETEEESLTKIRQTIDIEEFKLLAADFDSKVQRIRAETSRSRVKLNEYSDSERDKFFKLIVPILIDLSNEFGISTLLDHRMSILSLNDITDRAIERVDSIIGNGKKTTED